MKTKVINLVASPGTGKSVLSALLFAKLKTMHMSAEYVQEVAKFLIYQEKFDELNNQYNVSKNQYDIAKSIVGKQEWIIMDSPLILGLYYNRAFPNNICNVQKVEKFILNKIDEFNNIYIFLKRNKNHPYEKHGRIHTLEESIQIEKDLELLLNEFNIPYKSFISDVNSIPEIMDYILQFK